MKINLILHNNKTISNYKTYNVMICKLAICWITNKVIEMLKIKPYKIKSLSEKEKETREKLKKHQKKLNNSSHIFKIDNLIILNRKNKTVIQNLNFRINQNPSILDYNPLTKVALILSYKKKEFKLKN